MLFNFNRGNVKLSKKQQQSIENQINSINAETAKIYRKYTKLPYFTNQGELDLSTDINVDETSKLFQALNGVQDYIIITLVNDINHTFAQTVQEASNSWLQKTFMTHGFDVEDTVIEMAIINDEQELVNKLNVLLYQDIHDTKTKIKIAKVFCAFCAYVGGVSSAAVVDEHHRYTWGKDFIGQIFTFSFLRNRMKELFDNQFLAYTLFNGNEILYQHQLPFTGKEMVGREATRE